MRGAMAALTLFLFYLYCALLVWANVNGINVKPIWMWWS